MQDVDSKAEAERMTMYRCIILNIIESETVYVDFLNVMIQVSFISKWLIFLLNNCFF